MQLTEQQQAIINHNEGPALVFAVAGAGKTTTMVYRIERLVRERIFAPERILATSFNRAAARDIRIRLRQWSRCRAVKATTLHALGYSIIRRAIQQSYLPSLRVLEYNENLLFEALRMARRNDVWYKNDLEQLDNDDFLNFVGACKGNLRYADLRYADLPAAGLRLASQAEAPNRHLQWYVELYQLYEQARHQGGWLTFDDMLLTSWEVLIKFPDILAYVRSLFHCVLVDEFQDINFVQSEMLDLIVASHQNYMAIGDDDQTIYEWRGADPKFILNFETRYQATRYLISDNFRSPATQVVLANEVIKHNQKRAAKFLSLTRGFEGRVLLHSVKDDDTMGRDLVDEIQLLLKAGCHPQNMVVLLRIYAQTAYIEQYLIEKQIPYQVVGNVPFYRRREVVTLLHYCHVAKLERSLQAGHPLTVDEVELFGRAWRHIYNRPKRYISRVLSEKVREAVAYRHVSLRRALALVSADLSYWGKRNLRHLGQDIEWLMGKLERPAAKVLNQLERRLEYKEYLINSSGFPETGEAKAANVGALIKYAKGKGNILEFIQHLEDLSFGQITDDRQTIEEDDRRIKLMTIFRAKGLEWDHVFVPHCQDGTIPFGGDPDRREEERRLLYVAITRSRRHLHLYWTKSEMSHFLAEADTPKLVELVPKLEHLLATPPEQWSKKQTLSAAKLLSHFQFERFLTHWWSVPLETKQQVAKQILNVHQRIADKNQDSVRLTKQEIAFWQAYQSA